MGVDVQRFAGNINGVFNVISDVLDCVLIAFVLLLTLLSFLGVCDDEAVELLLGERTRSSCGGGVRACCAIVHQIEGAYGPFNLGCCLSCCQGGFVAGRLCEGCGQVASEDECTGGEQAQGYVCGALATAGVGVGVVRGCFGGLRVEIWKPHLVLLL